MARSSQASSHVLLPIIAPPGRECQLNQYQRDDKVYFIENPRICHLFFTKTYLKKEGLNEKGEDLSMSHVLNTQGGSPISDLKILDLFGWIEAFNQLPMNLELKDELASSIPDLIEQMLTGTSPAWVEWLNGKTLREEEIQAVFPTYEFLNEKEQQDIQNWLDVDYRTDWQELFDYYPDPEQRIELFYESGYPAPVCWIQQPV